ncbi:MAG: hypothetical protein NW206_07180 [Hyphomonadaceae bacterium]|nr:hypothetical protein [Hyphomonadaceae bacterium]
MALLLNSKRQRFDEQTYPAPIAGDVTEGTMDDLWRTAWTRAALSVMVATEKAMRFAALAALFALAACATIPDDLPTLRYADAASRGSVAAFFAGRPTSQQVDAATADWSRALGDSFSCGVPMRQTLDAGLVGALEIGAMNAAASRGGEREIREGVGRYVGQLAGLALQRREQPPQARCEALARWAPRTADAGREAVARARANGLMEDDYGLLLDLLGR